MLCNYSNAQVIIYKNKKQSFHSHTLFINNLGLQVRTKLYRPRVYLELPDKLSERWAMSFVHDQLSNGRQFRVLNVVDNYSHECIL